MTPELWERLNPLFNAAVECPSEERHAFVVNVCRDDTEMRRELMALLAAHEQQESANDGIAGKIRKVASLALPGISEGYVVHDRFRIVRRLGSGGMGEVYEAVDLDLSQPIALKMIRPEIAGNELILSRFKKEVQLARRVSGPNVCRIHEFLSYKSDGADQGIAFLTMELLNGVTLADKIALGPLTWREARELALDICAGLTTIHQAGIIHRDLKTRNIMIADRGGMQRAVLMDFGLAHELTPPSVTAETGLTVPGAVLGTPEYMAPEQFEGKAVTPATDIYAAGIVLYELVTGKHPFASNNALGAAVRRGRAPEPVSSLNHGIPHRWDQVINKCLEYEASRRYQSAAELAEALQGHGLHLGPLRRAWFRPLIGALTPVLLSAGLLLIPATRERLQGMLLSSHEKHVAVLPLDVSGNDEETMALGDGLMDSLSGKLTNMDSANKSLWVVPASEVRRRKVNGPSEARREFGATIVVKGSFERRGLGAHLRLTLIDSKAMREIGYIDAESDTGDLASMQDEAVTRMARLMNIASFDQAPRSSEAPASRAAYEDYLAGIGYFQRNDRPGNVELAIKSIQKALKIDPDFALGYARLAQIYTNKFLMTSDSQWLEIAEKNGKRAVQLDARIPTAYVALGQIHDFTGNHDLAIQEFQQAVNLDPRDSEALTGLANSFKDAGRNADAEAAYIKAAALRADDWKGYNDLGIFYEGVGRTREAIIQFNHALELTPDNAWPYVNLGVAYMDFDDPQMLDKADKALTKSIAITPTFAAYSNLGFLYAQQHRFTDSVAASKQALKLNDQNYDVWDNLTAAYEWLKQDKEANAARQKTIELVEQAIRVNPQRAAAQAKLAAMYAKNGDRQRAMEKVNIALALSPSDAYVLSQIADAYELMGDRKMAIRILQKALTKGLSKAALNEDPEIQFLIHDPRFTIPKA